MTTAAKASMTTMTNRFIGQLPMSALVDLVA